MAIDEQLADLYLKLRNGNFNTHKNHTNKLFSITPDSILQKNGKLLNVFRIEPFMLSGVSNDDVLSIFNSIWDFLNSVGLREHESMRLLVVQESMSTKKLEKFYDQCNREHMHPILKEINDALLAKSKINMEKSFRSFYLVSDAKYFLDIKPPAWLNRLSPSEYQTMVDGIYGSEITLQKAKSKQKKQKTLIANDQHLVTYAINRFPSFKSQYYMGELISESDIPSIVSFHFSHTDTEKVKKMINDSIGNMGLNLPTNLTEGVDFEETFAGYQQLAQEIKRTSEQIFNVTITVGVFGETEHEAIENGKSIRGNWKNHDHSIINIVNEGFAGYQNLLPLCDSNKLLKEFARQVHAKSLSRLWPATTDSFSHDKGLFLGFTSNKKPIILDILNDKSRNMAIYGDTGSGKTVILALIALRLASMGFEVLAIMPDRFPALPYIHQDLVFRLSSNSATFNPFHIHSTLVQDEVDEVRELKAGEYLDNKVNQVVEFVKNILPLKPLETVHLKEAILKTYARFDFTYDSIKLPDSFPTLQNLSEELKTYPDLENLTYILSENQYNHIFGKQTWNFGEYPITSFSLEHLPQGQIKNTVVDALLRNVWEYALTKDTPIAIIVDEGWQLVGNSSGSVFSQNTLAFLRQTAKLIRKRGVPKGSINEGAGMLITATQNLGDFLRSDDAQDVHKLARYKIYLPMSEIDRKAIDSVSSRPLSPEHKEILRDSSTSMNLAKKYGRGLLAIGDFSTFKIEVNPTDYEFRLIRNQGN